MKSEKINRKSFVPPFFQLASILEQRINSDDLKPGDPLPSEAELSNEYQLSRMTVRKCLNLLSERGMVIAYQGKGTFVSRPCLDRAVFVLEEFKKQLESHGLEPGHQLITARLLKPADDIARKLVVDNEERVLYYCRLLLANGAPYGLEHKYMRYVKGRPILENELQYKAFSEVIASNMDILPVRSHMTLEAATAREYEARLLEVQPGFPLLKVEQSLFSKDNLLIGIGIFWYHGERCRLVSEVQPLKGDG